MCDLWIWAFFICVYWGSLLYALGLFCLVLNGYEIFSCWCIVCLSIGGVGVCGYSYCAGILGIVVAAWYFLGIFQRYICLKNDKFIRFITNTMFIKIKNDIFTLKMMSSCPVWVCFSAKKMWKPCEKPLNKIPMQKKSILMLWAWLITQYHLLKYRINRMIDIDIILLQYLIKQLNIVISFFDTPFSNFSMCCWCGLSDCFRQLFFCVWCWHSPTLSEVLKKHWGSGFYACFGGVGERFPVFCTNKY